MNPLPSLRSDLLRHRLDDDILVYDPRDEQVHLLNASTAKVVELMDQGCDAGQIASVVGGGSAENGADMLALALDELALARLIENPAKVPVAPAFEGTTRRKMVQKLMGASAVLLIPGILTLTPSVAGAQGSTNLPNGTACTLNSQCASGCCAVNSAGTCTNAHCSPPGCGNQFSCTGP